MNAVAMSPCDAEQKIRGLGVKLKALRFEREAAPLSDKDAASVIKAIELDQRIEQLEHERTELGKFLLEHDRRKRELEIEASKVARQRAHEQLAELQQRLRNFVEQERENLARMGAEFQEIRELSEQLRRIDCTLENKTRQPAVSHGHLIYPAALEGIMRALVAESFDIDRSKSQPTLFDDLVEKACLVTPLQ